MLRKLLNIIGLLLVSLTFSRCALHTPISESILFEEKVESNNESLIFDDSEQDESKFLFVNYNSSSLNKSFYNNQFQAEALKTHNVSNEFFLNVLWQYGFSSINLLYSLDDRFYIGINPSLVFNAGIDFTYKASENIYITGSGNTLLNYEIIIQSEIINYRKFKASLGINFRHERQDFTIIYHSYQVRNIFGTNMLGVRSLFKIPIKSVSLSGVLGVYYEFSYGTPVFKLGLGYSLGSN